MRRYIFSFFILLFLISLIIFLRHDDHPLRSLVRTEAREVYVLDDSLYFSAASDTLLEGLSCYRDSAARVTTALGQTCNLHGHVQTCLPYGGDAMAGLSAAELQQRLQRTLVSMERRYKQLRRYVRSFDYYADTHTITDDGYNDVMAYRAIYAARLSHVEATLAVLRRHVEKPQHALRHLWTYYTGTLTADVSRATPVGGASHRALLVLRPHHRRAAQPDSVTHRPHSPYILTAASSDRPIYTLASEPLRALYGSPVMVCRDTASGAYYHLAWQTDTAFMATAYLPNGTFRRGVFDADLRPHGQGLVQYADGTFYDGAWQHGQRHGFGIGIEGRRVCAGIWRGDVFQGERMIYNAARIYGIDISRYQHEIGGKTYPIRWEEGLRITSLGTASRKRIQGEVSYPVSFVFIKATQGTTIYNRYYAADLAAARRHGIAVAPYHFFSMKAGAPQASYFLSHAQVSRATLPPMLDVEPSEAEIRQMGGDDVLFREVLVWLRQVEQQTGRTPILYVSQNFVNKHLPRAPKSIRRYPVWIARYGEYKPYVRLLIWQLAADGRVRGIKGDVDINVFNGSKADFEALIRR